MISPVGTIFLFGLLSLCGDIIYESGRSVMGPYLALLGASAFSVGLVSGTGEFIGYGLRVVFGHWADRTKAYWPMTALGYSLILVVPLLAFSRCWQTAALLIFLERLGKAIRSPSRDTLLSQSAKMVGTGFGFGIHEALDQVGAIAGPFVFSFFLLRGHSYQFTFHLLWIPGLLLLATLLVLRNALPALPRETDKPEKMELKGIFGIYLGFVFLCFCGFVNFPLIAYHAGSHRIFLPGQIPLLYVLAMAVDGLAALIVGPAYDFLGLKVLIGVPLLSMLVPFLCFTRSAALIILSLIIWGVVVGMQETVMRSSVVALSGSSFRGLAYGLLNTVSGTGALVAGLLAGFLYAHADYFLRPALLSIEVAATALAGFLLLRKKEEKRKKEVV